MLEKILSGRIDLIGQFDCNQAALLEEVVVITPKYVRSMLEKYLQKNISAEDLQKWAAFVCIRSEYAVPGGYDDQIHDYYEPMYYVIQRLSTPELDGDITQARIKEYMKELVLLKEPE